MARIPLAKQEDLDTLEQALDDGLAAKADLVGGTVPDEQIPASIARDSEVTAAVVAAVNSVLNGAPAALDTLDELAAALGDDASFAATVTTALAGKQPLDSDLTAIAALTTTSFGRSFLALVDAAAGRTLLGLGTAALAASGDFDPAGSAAAAQAASQPLDADLTAIAALTTTTFGRGLLALADAAGLRSAAGLGSAALAATGDFEPAGAVAAAVANLINSAPGALDTLDELAAALGDDASFAASMTSALAGKQPIDSDLTAIAALATTTFGRSLLTLADVAALRSAAGLGTAATANTGDFEPAGAVAAEATLRAAGDAALIAVEDVTGASYTFVLADAGKMKRFDRATAQTATVPPNSSVAFPVGSVIELSQVNVGALTVAAGAGVTINVPAGFGLVFGTQWQAATLVKTGTDRWLLVPANSGAYETVRSFAGAQLWNSNGSPSLASAGTAGRRWLSWLMDATTEEGVGCNVKLPSHWTAFHVYLLWSNEGAGSGDVVWRVDRTWGSDGDNLDAAETTGENVTATAPAQNVGKRTLLTPSGAIAIADVTKWLRFEIQRTAANAADTLANDAGVRGVELVKA